MGRRSSSVAPRADIVTARRLKGNRAGDEVERFPFGAAGVAEDTAGPQPAQLFMADSTLS